MYHFEHSFLHSIHMIKDSIHHQVQIFIPERLDPIDASDRSRLCRLALVAKDVFLIGFTNAFLADAFFVKAKVCEHLWEIHEAFFQVGKACIVFAIHAETEIIIENVSLPDGCLMSVKTGGGANVTSLLNEYAFIEG